MEPLQAQAVKQQPSFIFWLLFVIAAMLAWSITLAVSAMLGSFDHLKGLWVAALVAGPFQWWVLRRRIRQAVAWIPATSIPAFLAGMFILLGGSLAATAALFFTGIGVAQVLVLKYSVRRGWLWLPVKAAAFVLAGLAAALPMILVLYSESGSALLWALVGLIAGAAFGAVEGGGLLLLLRAPAPQPWKPGALARIAAGLLALLLLIAPFYAILQFHSLQARALCDTLEIGMPRAEANSRLSSLRPASESGLSFGYAGGAFAVPESLQSRGAGVTHFYNVELKTSLVTLPPLGLGYDAAENLALISSDVRSYTLNYQPAQCPWSLQDSLGTLFK